jgi:hypothetical protein
MPFSTYYFARVLTPKRFEFGYTLVCPKTRLQGDV